MIEILLKEFIPCNLKACRHFSTVIYCKFKLFMFSKNNKIKVHSQNERVKINIKFKRK